MSGISFSLLRTRCTLADICGRSKLPPLSKSVFNEINSFIILSHVIINLFIFLALSRCAGSSPSDRVFSTSDVVDLKSDNIPLHARNDVIASNWRLELGFLQKRDRNMSVLMSAVPMSVIPSPMVYFPIFPSDVMYRRND